MEGKIDSLTAYHRSGSDVCETTIECCSCEILIVDFALSMGERVRVLLCRRPSGVNTVSTLSSRREAHDISLRVVSRRKRFGQWASVSSEILCFRMIQSEQLVARRRLSSRQESLDMEEMEV